MNCVSVIGNHRVASCIPVIVACSVLATGLAGGAVLVSEDFEYPTGEIAGSAGGSGFSAPWAGAGVAAVVSPGLSYPGLTASGNALFDNAFSFQSPSRTFSAGIGDGTPNTTIYFSILLNLQGSAGSGYLGFELSGASSSASNLYIGHSQYMQGSDTQYGVGGLTNDGNAFTSQTRGGSISYGGVDFITGQVVFSGTPGDGQDVASIYIDPAGSTQPAFADATVTDNFTNFNQIDFLGSGSPGEFGQFIIGTTYADVIPVPEPSSMTLVLGASCVLAAYVRNRRVCPPPVASRALPH